MKMTMSQIARLAGVSVETVRFYEREGLISQPARPETGYRQYSLDTVSRIQFIKRAKELGFSRHPRLPNYWPYALPKSPRVLT